MLAPETAFRNPETAKYAPLVGALIGAVSALIYWLAMQLWPASVAVILAMAVSAAVLFASKVTACGSENAWVRVFYILIKYSALMALSAANVSWVTVPNVSLGLIMICGHAASFALAVAVSATRPAASASKISLGTLLWSLCFGFLPAWLLGLSGLIALAAAIIVTLGLIAVLKWQALNATSSTAERSQMISEIGFYLGALASWSFV